MITHHLTIHTPLFHTDTHPHTHTHPLALPLLIPTNTPTRVQPINPNHSSSSSLLSSSLLSSPLPSLVIVYKRYRLRRRSIDLRSHTAPSPTFRCSLSISAALSVNSTLCPSPLPELHFRSSPENSRFPSSHSENARIPHEGTRR